MSHDQSLLAKTESSVDAPNPLPIHLLILFQNCLTWIFYNLLTFILLLLYFLECWNHQNPNLLVSENILSVKSQILDFMEFYKNFSGNRDVNMTFSNKLFTSILINHLYLKWLTKILSSECMDKTFLISGSFKIFLYLL